MPDGSHRPRRWRREPCGEAFRWWGEGSGLELSGGFQGFLLSAIHSRHQAVF